jgi:crossover junction endodeoxyribonuclease RusA
LTVTIDIGWPVKALWPNGRAHHQVKARATKAMREQASLLTRATFVGGVAPELPLPVPVTIFCRYKNESHRPDEDNVVGACKAALDGMATRLGINDRHFESPRVRFLKDSKCRRTLVIQLGRAV